MKIFNFEESHHSKKSLEWLKLNQNKKVSEEEFVKAWQELKPHRTGASYKYAPSHLKKHYRKLKAEFGFFK